MDLKQVLQHLNQHPSITKVALKGNLVEFVAKNKDWKIFGERGAIIVANGSNESQFDNIFDAIDFVII